MRKLTQAGVFIDALRPAKKITQAGKKFLLLMAKALDQSWRTAKKTELTTMSGSLAFTTVLSIAPLVAVLFYVFKIFGGLDYAYAKLMPFLLANLSEGSGEIVEEHLGTFIRQVHANAVGWAGIAGLLFTSIMTYFNVVTAFNKIWSVEKPRAIHHRIFKALTLILFGPLLLAASLAITTAVAAQIKVIPYSGQLVAYLLSTLLYSMVYALLPSTKVQLKTIFFGSLFPALMLELAKIGYAVYTKKIVTYSTFYGSFAAIPLFLLWIYIAWWITLFGAAWIKALDNNTRTSRG